MKLSEICEKIGLNFIGVDKEISSMNTLQDADATQLSFFHDKKYINDLATTSAAAVILTADLADKLPEGVEALVVPSNPYLFMAKASQFFTPKLIDSTLEKAKIGEGSYVAEKATVENGAIIGSNCTIMAGAYIGTNVTIGDNTIIHPNVTIYRNSIVGSNCIIHASSVIGSDGFGFAHNADGSHIKFYQNGNVVIEDDVEIGSNTSVDCAVFGSTYIRKGAKLDNLIQIGHNCDIGEYSIMVAQSGSAGSTKLGRNVVVGGQAAIAGHLEIAPFTTLASRTGVTKSIKESGKTFAGFPMMEHKKWLKLQARIASLLKK